MKKVFIALLFVFSQASLATPLTDARIAVIHRYLVDLQIADADDILTLFEKEATVVSTSKGRIAAKDFFTTFLSDIASANTQLKQHFITTPDNDHYAARFHFTYTLKNGEIGNGEYLDEFIFSPHSNKLLSVYMFENTKFI